MPPAVLAARNIVRECVQELVDSGSWLGTEAVAPARRSRTRILTNTDHPIGGGNFYSIFPHNLLVSLFAPVFLFATLALAMGVRRLWREITPATSGAPVNAAAGAEAAHDVLRLKYLDGSPGEGCMTRTMPTPAPAGASIT